MRRKYCKFQPIRKKCTLLLQFQTVVVNEKIFENRANQKAFCPISHFEKKICQGLPSIIFIHYFLIGSLASKKNMKC